MANWRKVCVIISGVAGLLGSNAVAEKAAPRETVLAEGQSISAKNKNGVFRIEYSGDQSRTYFWNGKQRRVKMIVREDRFQGMLGLYNPASSLTSFGTRVVVQEAVRNFASREEVAAFLRQGGDIMDWVYTKDGLVAGFGVSPERGQVNIDVWQVLIRGRKPSNLGGARPGQITLESARDGISHATR